MSVSDVSFLFFHNYVDYYLFKSVVTSNWVCFCVIFLLVSYSESTVFSLDRGIASHWIGLVILAHTSSYSVFARRFGPG